MKAWLFAVECSKGNGGNISLEIEVDNINEWKSKLDEMIDVEISPDLEFASKD